MCRDVIKETAVDGADTKLLDSCSRLVSESDHNEELALHCRFSIIRCMIYQRGDM